ncbi:MAG: TrkH family potassium uptake protein [Pseudomonadota bacterium]
MIDFRPVGYVIGLLVSALGATMLVPMVVDMFVGNGHWPVFLESAVITCLSGGLVAIACANGRAGQLTLQQTFLVTSLVWVVMPVFGGLPFVFGATASSATDAFFEAMSGLTTTGATVLSGLDEMPHGLLLWRSLLQWFGGIGIIVVAMVFLPALRIGGMQIFRSEAFDTQGKILPRAAEIAARISWIYLGLTVAAFIMYAAVGMTAFEALCHALTSISTGGFSTTDASFAAFKGAPEYVAVVIMVFASLPFVLYVHMLAGSARALWTDPQVRTFIGVLLVISAALTLHQTVIDDRALGLAFREALFNTVSITSGTGYASTDYQAWGAFPICLFFFMGLIGGCAGSTSCSIKIFRYQLLFSVIGAQIRRIHSPNGVFSPRYAGRTIDDDVISSVIAFFVLFTVSLGVLAILLGITGLDFISSISGAASALANIGPGLGPEIGPVGNYGGLNDTAKWLLAIAMWIGRLELLAVYVLLTVNFWRAA